MASGVRSVTSSVRTVSATGSSLTSNCNVGTISVGVSTTSLTSTAGASVDGASVFVSSTFCSSISAAPRVTRALRSKLNDTVFAVPSSSFASVSWKEVKIGSSLNSALISSALYRISKKLSFTSSVSTSGAARDTMRFEISSILNVSVSFTSSNAKFDRPSSNARLGVSAKALLSSSTCVS